MRGRIFDLSTIYCVSIKDSVNFIRCNVIICLHTCGHTKNVISHVINFNRCQIYLQLFFVWLFNGVVLICWGIVMHSEMFWVVSFSPVFMSFAPVKSVPVLFFRPRFTRCWSGWFPCVAIIVKPCVTNIYILVSIFMGWLFKEIGSWVLESG